MSTGGCWAVGHAGAAPGQRLVEHYAGGRWVAVDGAGGSGDGSTLAAVWCSNSLNCWAVGSSGDRRTLTEHYDGSSWTEIPSADAAAGDTDSLTGVTCSPAGACWAVGSRTRGGVQRILIERRTGSTWTVIDSPAPAFSNASSLHAVTCRSDADCWAVGIAQSAAGSDQGLIEQYNGVRWDLTRTPAVTSATFSAVTCPEDDDCFAVGTCSAGTMSPCHGSTSLIELYDLILPEGH
jgi:hypothetical protein